MYDHTAAPVSARDGIHNVNGSSRAPGPRFSIYGGFFKRLMDCALIVLSLPFVLPIVVIAMIAVARDGHSPFYSQKRIGRGGRVFRIWKLRTMVPDADKILKSYLAENPAAAAEWDETQKLKNDPRITSAGRFLRKSSVDELPQLWNVLLGDMSLVGPRPMMVDQEDLYPGKAYYALRPGLTGLWQISDRNETSFAARATFDTTYHRELSFATDFKILKSTFGVVLRGTGY